MKNTPLLMKLFVGFILFLLIPLIIISSIFNYYMLKYSEEEISKASSGNLKIISNLNKMMADNLSKDALRLSLNNSINRLYGIDNYDETLSNAEDVLKISDCLDVLTEMMRTNNMIQSVYLYLENSDYILTTNNGVVLKNDFNDNAWLEVYDDYKSGKVAGLWIKTRQLPEVKTETEKSIDKFPQASGQQVITYVYPLTGYTTNLRGAFIINIYEYAFSNMVNYNIRGSDGYIMVIDNEGNAISHIDKTLVGRNITGLPYYRNTFKSTSVEGHELVYIDNIKYLITYFKSEFNKWIYVGVFPLDKLMDKMAQLRMKVSYILIAVVFIGLVMSYLISKWIFSPVQVLVRNIKKRKDFRDLKSKNEVIILSRVFETLSQQEEQFKDVIEKNKRNIRDINLLNLLNGNFQQDMENKRDVLGFKHSGFVCALVAIDRYETFNAAFTMQQQFYYKLLILNICEEILNDLTISAGVVMERERIAIVINTNVVDEELLFKNLKVSFMKITKETEKVMDNKISIAIGGYHARFSGIKDSYLEAIEAMNRRMILGHGSIIFREGKSAEGCSFYPFSEEKHIFNCLGLARKDDTIAAVNEFINSLRITHDISMDNLTHIFIQLTGATIKYLIDSDIKITDIFGAEKNIYRQLAALETLEDIADWFVKIFIKIIDYSNSKSDKMYYSSKIIEYIHRNLRKDIDINVVADYVGLSYSYVRKVFKEETGKNLVDYINYLRIDEAKKLLSETNASIVEIALRLGYNNDQSFNRFFKKYEGITPGEFRRVHM